MTTLRSRAKLFCFWILLLIPIFALLEFSSWIIIQNGIPSRIRARVGNGSAEFHVLQRARTSVLQPDLVKKPANLGDIEDGEGSGLVMFHPELGWDYPPGIVYRDLDGIVYSHGPNGERLSEIKHGRPSIATYGDSFTYGTNVGDEATWQEFLSDDLGVNVLNFGVAGYGTDQAYLKYRMQSHLRTEVVMLCIWPENINRVVNIYRPFLHYNERLGLTKPRFIERNNGFELVPNALTKRSDVGRLNDPAFLARLGEMDYWFLLDQGLSDLSFPYLVSVIKWRRPLFKQFALSLRRYVPTSAEVGFAWNLFDEPEPLAVMCHIVDRFVETARSRGSLPIVVILPHKDQVRELLDYRVGRADRLVRYLKARNYPFVDVMQAIADMQPDAAQLERWYDHHSTPAGNQIIAGIIARHLKRNRAEWIKPESGENALAGLPESEPKN